MDITGLIEAHSPHVALQFSGGRDSLAMLLLMQPVWDKLTVYYLNSGDAYPETLALVEKVRRAVPHFKEVQGRTLETHAKYGWPSDVLHPGAMWPAATAQIKGHQPLFDRYFCCSTSIMVPMHRQIIADEITLVLRGQRDSDNPKSQVNHGETVDGLTVLYPINSWDETDVDDYIKAQGWAVPPYYAMGLTSAPDCMHCTAWLEHKALSYLEVHHPDTGAEVRRRLTTIRALVQPALTQLDSALNNIEG